MTAEVTGYSQVKSEHIKEVKKYVALLFEDEDISYVNITRYDELAEYCFDVHANGFVYPIFKSMARFESPDNYL